MVQLINTTAFAALISSGLAALACDQNNAVAQNNHSASSLIDAAIQALGGREALATLQSVIYESNEVFRVRTLMQNYNLFETDRYVVSAGFQNVSFSFQNDNFSQRIDRSFVPAELFIFAIPGASVKTFSMVARGGVDGFVCLVKGSNNVLIPASQPYGYLDSAMADYLLLQARKLSPRLLLEVQTHCPVAEIVTFREKQYDAVYDNQMNITIAFDPDSHLPFLIRSFEDNPILGLTTKDLQLYNYIEVDGMLFPQQQKVLYGEDDIIEETIVSHIYVNNTFEAGFFDGLAANKTDSIPSPKPVPGYGPTELGEYWSNTIWAGLYPGTYSNVLVSQPAADLPGAHHFAVLENPNFSQLILEFEDSVIVFESPPHQSDLVIRWLSHHHHDHSFDIAKFVKIGASVIVPEMAASYYSQIPGIKFIKFTEDKPYIHSDGKMQARFIWRPRSPHSADWTYAMVTAACPKANSSMLAFTADVYTTNFEVDPINSNWWLRQTMDDRLSRNTTVVPAHGTPAAFSNVFEGLGSPYPNFNSTSFVRGGQICLQGLVSR